MAVPTLVVPGTADASFKDAAPVARKKSGHLI